MKKIIAIVMVLVISASMVACGEATIVGATVNDAGHLVFSLSDGTSTDAGIVRDIEDTAALLEKQQKIIGRWKTADGVILDIKDTGKVDFIYPVVEQDETDEWGNPIEVEEVKSLDDSYIWEWDLENDFLIVYAGYVMNFHFDTVDGVDVLDPGALLSEYFAVKEDSYDDAVEADLMPALEDQETEETEEVVEETENPEETTEDTAAETTEAAS